MTERPIIFSGPEVRAILAGTKTQARRVVKPERMYDGHEIMPQCPYGGPGDRLWVREPWTPMDGEGGQVPALYRADYEHDRPERWKWRPSIHMPRWASRITLEVEAVRCERVQAISDIDIRLEGVDCPSHDFSGGFCIGPRCPDLRAKFRDLWDSLNARRGYPWEANPWAWAIAFRRVKA